MMHWLLKYEGYPPSVAAAVLLHAMVLWFIFDKNDDRQEQVRIERPVILATTVQDNPQRTRRVEELELQRQQQRQRDARDRQLQQERTAQQQRQQEAQQKEESERVALQKRKQDEAKKAEENKQRVAKEQEQQRQRQQEEARQQAQREAELAKQQAAIQQALTEEQQLVAQYSAIIHDLITQNWQLPPGARNGMRAVVSLRLIPTGEIISRDIVEGSGDSAFDRSVLQAIDRVGSFPELKEVPIAVFDRNFRAIALEFTPQDLLR